jgi:hypothetical protein
MESDSAGDKPASPKRRTYEPSSTPMPWIEMGNVIINIVNGLNAKK